MIIILLYRFLLATHMLLISFFFIKFFLLLYKQENNRRKLYKFLTIEEPQEQDFFDLDILCEKQKIYNRNLDKAFHIDSKRKEFICWTIIFVSTFIEFVSFFKHIV